MTSYLLYRLDPTPPGRRCEREAGRPARRVEAEARREAAAQATLLLRGA